MDSEVLYTDNLLEISRDSILLKKYYFPFMNSKEIKLKDVERILRLEPTLANGKWRIWGSGDFRTWFPYDSKRPLRDKIFIIKYKHKWLQTGFTAENSQVVSEILHSANISLQ